MNPTWWFVFFNRTFASYELLEIINRKGYKIICVILLYEYWRQMSDPWFPAMAKKIFFASVGAAQIDPNLIFFRVPMKICIEELKGRSSRGEMDFKDVTILQILNHRGVVQGASVMWQFCKFQNYGAGRELRKDMKSVNIMTIGGLKGKKKFSRFIRWRGEEVEKIFSCCWLTLRTRNNFWQWPYL